MMGLVKFCLDTTSNEDPTSTPSLAVMDADRRAWLEQVISSMTIDVTKQLLENLATVKEIVVQIERNPTQDIDVQRACNAIEVLTDLCEEIDYASDFAKLDGFSIFKPLIGSSHEQLIVKACELIAALTQNNSICQDLAMKTKLLQRLVEFINKKHDQSQIKARSFALYAMSSIIRSNEEVRSHFETQLDGLTVLLELLDRQSLDDKLDAKPEAAGDRDSSSYWWRKLRIRTVFLFRTLCGESARASTFFYERHAIKQITELLICSQDLDVREHLLNALDSYLSSINHDMQIESLKSAPNLKNVLQQVQVLSQQGSNDDFDFTETRSVCKKVLDLIDSSTKE